MSGLDLLLAVLSGGAGRDLAAACVDEDFNGMRKERSLLNMVVGDELKGAMLRVDRSFVVGRAVFEVEKRLQGDAIAADGLKNFT